MAKNSGPISEKLFADTKDSIYQFREQPFTLASGRQSNHYFNCKHITLDPELLWSLARAFRDELIPEVLGEGAADFQACGGLTLGADPMAYALSLAYREASRAVYPIVVRKEAKGHGTGRQIEGKADHFKEVLLLDDVITTGGSSLKAVAALREAGLPVRHCLCIVDRQEGGAQNMAAENVALHPLFQKSDFTTA